MDLLSLAYLPSYLLIHLSFYIVPFQGKVVHLVSQEGDQYEVDVSVVKMSELVKTMLPGKSLAALEGILRTNRLL